LTHQLKPGFEQGVAGDVPQHSNHNKSPVKAGILCYNDSR